MDASRNARSALSVLQNGYAKGYSYLEDLSASTAAEVREAMRLACQQ